jgi:protein O-GlcNAc transferase
MSELTAQQNFDQALRLHQAGRVADALALYQSVLDTQPDHADALNLSGVALSQLGDHVGGLARLDRAVALRAHLAPYHGNRGLILARMTRIEDAIDSFQKALAIAPNDPWLLFTVADAYRQVHRPADAVACYRRALVQRPNDAGILNNLGCYLCELGELDEALAVLQQAAVARPDFAPTHLNLGRVFKDRGQIDKSVASYRRGVELDPASAPAHSDLIYTIQFHPDYDASGIYREHRLWNTRHAEPIAKAARSASTNAGREHTNDPDPDRRLRVGYVSPDFRRHIVGISLLPLLENHDHRAVEVFCYSAVREPDDMTTRLRSSADQWRDISHFPPAGGAEQIRADKIDILVDLTMHMVENRLLLFALKPAPIQLTYLAYCGTTGLDAIDCRFSDPHMDPPDTDLSVYSERTIRLPRTYWCYNPPEPCPPIQPLPAIANGHITFGCLNNFAKASPKARELWARILDATPNSRLLLHAPAQHGGLSPLPPDRVEIIGSQPFYPYYLNTYNRIDIALDTTPWGGGITTCDALWMGVPIITLSGGTSVGRGGRSILNNIGLPELVASSPDDYVKLAVALAADRPRLSDLRSTLRQRMQASPLTDARQFARDVEAAYRQMWQQWVDRGF